MQNPQTSVRMINGASRCLQVRADEACGSMLEDAPTSLSHSLACEGLFYPYNAGLIQNGTDQKSVQSDNQTLDTDSNAMKDCGDRSAQVAQVRGDEAPAASPENKMITRQQPA